MNWLSLSLVCALSLAAADAGTKAWLGDYRARELALVRFGTTGILMSPILSGINNLCDLPLQFWFWVLAMVPLEILAMLLYMKAIRDHPLSVTLPYLAFTPVFVIVTGYILLDERIDANGVLGISLVVAGAWRLNQENARPWEWRTWGAPFVAILSNPGSRIMLGVAFIYSLTAAMGKGAMEHMDAERFGAFYFSLLGAASVLVFAVPVPRVLLGIWRRPFGMIAVALLNGVMVYTHFLAIRGVEVAYMIAVKRTSLLFGILFGALLFGERGLGIHLVAGGLMLGGLFLIVV